MGLLETFKRAVARRRADKEHVFTVPAETDKWQPLSEYQARKLMAKYPNDVELWNSFWEFMAEQSDRGAPYEYVYACCDILERAWSGERSHFSGEYNIYCT